SEEQLLENETFQKTTEEEINHESIDQVSGQKSEEENIEHTNNEINEDSLPKESYKHSTQETSSETITTNDVEVLEESEIEKDVSPTPKNHESKVRTLSTPSQVASFSTMSLKSEMKKAPEIKTVNYATRIKNENNSGLYSPVTNKKGKDATRFLNQTLFISESTKVNGNTYYKILKGVNGPMQGWMKQSDLDLYGIYNHRKHNETLYVDSNYKNDYLFADPYGTSKQHVKKIRDTGSSTFKTKETIKIGAVTFYYGTLGNSEGWLSESRLTRQSQPAYSSARFAARISNGNNNSGIYSP